MTVIKSVEQIYPTEYSQSILFIFIHTVFHDQTLFSSFHEGFCLLGNQNLPPGALEILQTAGVCQRSACMFRSSITSVQPSSVTRAAADRWFNSSSSMLPTPPISRINYAQMPWTRMKTAVLLTAKTNIWQQRLTCVLTPANYLNWLLCNNYYIISVDFN